VIDVSDLPSHLFTTAVPRHATQVLDEVLAATERDVITSVLGRNGGQVSSAAEELGLTRQGLYKKIKRLGIDVSSLQHDVALQDSH
jgi:transcriptional regulator of acetoin/glycerol metabolism